MKELLQRRPLGIPLHESATNWALALMFASVLLDLVAWLGLARDTTGTNVGAYAVLFAALIVTVLAALASLADTLDLPDDVRRLGWVYTAALTVVSLLEIGGLVLRNGSLQDQVVTPIALFLSLTTLVVFGATAWLGGSVAAREIEEELEQELEEPTPLRKRRRR